MEYMLGVLVSLFAELIKKKFGGGYKVLIIVIVLSFVAAGAYMYLEKTSFWPLIVQVLAVAGAFHNFIIRRFEKESK